MLRKYFKYIFPIILIMGVLPFVFIKRDKDTLSLLEEKDMLAYTIDGVSVGSSNMPAKGSGYVVSSITCKNGSKLVWDNDNWELEMVTLEDFDSCVIDFTKDITKSSPRVTLISEMESTNRNFEYNGTNGTDGSVQIFTAPVDGEYLLEVWGAQGGSYTNDPDGNKYYGGAGGYSKGTITLKAGTELYVYVGGSPSSLGCSNSINYGGYNGGGNGMGSHYGNTWTCGRGGGGATDIRVGSPSLYSRVIVAGGGGGSAHIDAKTTKYGGGLTGGSPTSGLAGTQTSGGTSSMSNIIFGSFGQGASVPNLSGNYRYTSGGGGGGWYGGAACTNESDSAESFRNYNGGGSGYVYTSSTASSYPERCALTSQYYLKDAETIAGNQSFPSPTGETETGHEGYGYAKITYKGTISKNVIPNGLNSSSKTTTINGTITFYLKDGYAVSELTGCNGKLVDNKIIFENVENNINCQIEIKRAYSLVDAILRDNTTVSERTDFSTPFYDNTTETIYNTTKSEDLNENGVGENVYYYAGNTTNNWVKFGKYSTTLSGAWNAGDEIYWRIIRTNEDGSVRLLYVGNKPDTTNGCIGTGTFNPRTTNFESKYAGYMYGGETSLNDNRKNLYSSTVKQVVDKWYVENLLTNYDKYISKDAIYCNDRSIYNGTWSNIGGTTFYFGTYARINKYKSPSYKCGVNESNNLIETLQSKSDKFNSSGNNGGNGLLKCSTANYTDKNCPIALMTADEVVFAGGKYQTQLTSPYAWFFTNSAGTSVIGSGNWWTMSPHDAGSTVNIMFVSYNNGYFNSYAYYNNLQVRPVLSILPCAKVKGFGTSTDPYVIDEANSTC